MHTATATIFTWPLVAHLGSRLPLGQEDVATVPFFNLWTLEWNAQRFAHLLQHYWDAPIFAPTRGAFARSEAQPLTGAAFAVLRSAFGSVGGYNLVLIGFLVLNGIAGARFARIIGASLAAAILVGIAAQTLPFVFAQLGVLQLVCVFPFIFAFERLIAYQRSRRLVALLQLGAWFVVCALTSGYYAIFLAIMLLVAAPVMLIGVVSIKRLIAHVAITAIGIAIVVSPYLLSQQHLTTGEHWSLSTVANLSAQPSDYLDRVPGRVALPVLRDDGNNNGIQESPGVYLVALALVGAVSGWRQGQRRIVTALLTASGVMFTFSLGLHLSIRGWKPYRMLYDHVPGFDRLRSPFRYSVGVQLCLVMLAAFALARLCTWRPRGGTLFAVGSILLVTLDVVPFGAALTTVPNVASMGWVKYLERAPRGTIAMVPFPPTGHVGDFLDTTVGMLAGLEHGHPMVNGYTGLFPAEFDAPATSGGLWSAMDDFPSWCGAEQLHQRKVVYLVAARAWFTPARAAAIDSLGYRELFRDRTAVVLRDTMQYRLTDECA